MKSYTDLNQSKKLIELGIDRKSSDMYYWCGEDIRIGGYMAQDTELDIPAWSLAALLDLMPRSICIRETEFSGYFYFLEWQFANDNSLRYVGHNRDCLIDIYSDHDVGWKDSIDTAFEMICWLKENSKL